MASMPSDKKFKEKQDVKCFKGNNFLEMIWLV
jgi:hypothetical protein